MKCFLEKKGFIFLLLLFSVLSTGCVATQEEIDEYIAEMDEIASNLDATTNYVAQENWAQAQNSLDKAMTHLSTIDNGINDLEQRGVDPAQIERGRAGSTYLHKASDVMYKIIAWNMDKDEVKTQPDGLEGGTEEDIQRVIDAINTLTSDLNDMQDSIDTFVEYSEDYRSKYPEDAQNFEVGNAIQDMEQLNNQLKSRSSQFETIKAQLQSKILGGQGEGPTTVVGPGGCTTGEECGTYCRIKENFEECTQWCDENPAFCGK